MVASSCPSYETSCFASELRRGGLNAIPVMLGFIPFGLLLGAQAAQKGILVTNLMLMTGLNFGGGSEFAAVSLWSSSPAVMTIVMVSILVNSRHLLMGAAFAPLLSQLPRRKALLVLFFMCDESWAMGMADTARRCQEGRGTGLSVGFYFGLALSLWATWIVSTGIGAYMGPFMGDIAHWGFDMAFPAVFFVLLKGMWKNVRSAFPWLVSLICAGTVYGFIPGAWYVPAGALTGLAAILFLNRNTS